MTIQADAVTYTSVNGYEISDRLYYRFDASDTSSYPGSGTTWYDLATANNTSRNGVMIGNVNPTITGTGQKKYFNFPRNANAGFTIANAYNTVAGTRDTLLPATNFTYSIWVIPNSSCSIYPGSYSESNTSQQSWSTTTNNFAINPYYGSNVTLNYENPVGVSVGTDGVMVLVSAFYFYNGWLGINSGAHRVFYNLLSLSYGLSTTVPTNICVVFKNNTPSVFINGVIQRTGISFTSTIEATNTLGHYTGVQTTAGDGTVTSVSSSFSGRIYYASCYYKSLTNDEVMMNFMTMRSRFGV